MIVGSSLPWSMQAGPGSAPALCGPTRSEPPASTQAIVPPPAPMATRSTAGKRIGMFQSTRHSDAIDGRPS